MAGVGRPAPRRKHLAKGGAHGPCGSDSNADKMMEPMQSQCGGQCRRLNYMDVRRIESAQVVH